MATRITLILGILATLATLLGGVQWALHEYRVWRASRKSMKPWVGPLLLLVFCLWPSIGESACTGASPTWTTTPDYASVSSCVGQAINGDTVNISAGSATWTTTGLGSNCSQFASQDVSFCLPGSHVDGDSKYITIQGAGCTLDGNGVPSSCQTVITDQVPKNIAGAPSIFYWRLIPGGLSRITGIEFHEGTYALDCTGAGNNIGTISIYGNSDQFRFDHNKVVPDKACMGLNAGGTNVAGQSYVRGVLDHNFFDVSAENGYCVYVFNGQSWGNIGTGGDNSWAQPDAVGTAEFLFFENNTFYFDQANGHPFAFCIDGWQGGRAVFRNNKFQATQLGNHGADSGVRSQRLYEIYDNAFEGPGGVAMDLKGQTVGHFISSRGGVMVITNNTLTTTNGTLQYAFEGGNFRSNSLQASPIYGFCDGTNVWDQNNNGTATGYLCLDQIGAGYGDRLVSTSDASVCSGAAPKNVTQGCINAWPRQVAQPTYVWGNTINGSAANSHSVDTPDVVVLVGRDIIDGTARPGWTRYTYPHPLVGTVITPSPVHGKGKHLKHFIEAAGLLVSLGWHFRRALLASAMLLVSGISTVTLALPTATAKTTYYVKQASATVLLAMLPKKGDR